MRSILELTGWTRQMESDLRQYCTRASVSFMIAHTGEKIIVHNKRKTNTKKEKTFLLTLNFLCSLCLSRKDEFHLKNHSHLYVCFCLVHVF